ncbi:MAG: ABC transporter permease [Alphaproteobacteria bacterium]|nr:ABC transporter permease [Alphaproteobacteria bacterium]
MTDVPATMVTPSRVSQISRVVGQLAVAVVAALACGAVLILVAGANPVVGYVALFNGAFGSLNSIVEVLVKATPLLLAGLGIAIAFKSGYWNIGAEGQIFMGALAAVWVGLNAHGWPAYVAMPAIIGAGFLGGAVWGLIPGILRARIGASEIITTIMFNYIAFFVVNYFVTGPLVEADQFLPQTDPIAKSAELPRILRPTRLHAGIFIAMAATVALYWVMIRSTFGFRARVVGANEAAARYAGISVGWTWLVVSGVAGGLAGLAGMVEVAGVHQLLLEDISGGMGFTAIVVALLGWLHPVGVVIAAILFAALDVGADSMQRVIGVPVTLVYIIQALVVLFVLARSALEHDMFRRIWRRFRPE